MTTKQPFISSQQTFAVHSLCAKPCAGVTGWTSLTAPLQMTLAAFQCEGTHSGFWWPLYAVQEKRTTEQWQQRSPAVTSHPQIIYSKGGDGRARRHASNKESSDGSTVSSTSLSRTIGPVTVWLMDSPLPRTFFCIVWKVTNNINNKQMWSKKPCLQWIIFT